MDSLISLCKTFLKGLLKLWGLKINPHPVRVCVITQALPVRKTGWPRNKP